MKQFKLNNGVLMPAFGLGTFRVEPGESAYETVLAALKMGYRHIDTAIMYGNESDVGKAIRDSKIPRQEIFVTSKIAKHYLGDKALIMKALDESLERLNIGYIDLMLIHWPNQDDAMNQLVWSVLESYYEAKKFRAIGVSNFQKHHLTALLEKAKIKPQVNQVECHPLLNQTAMHKFLVEHDIQMTSYGPFAKGKVFEGQTLDVLTEIAKDYGASVSQVIIAWGLMRNIVMIPKSVHEERLLENFKGQELVLSASDIEKINGLNRGSRLYTDPDNNTIYL